MFFTFYLFLNELKTNYIPFIMFIAVLYCVYNCNQTALKQQGLFKNNPIIMTFHS
jgi:hypothetical protein